MALGKRGVALTEALIASVLTASLVGACAALYGYTMTSAASETAKSAVILQASQAIDDISATISQAKSCVIKMSGSASALVCTLPNTGEDRNIDGVIDIAHPTLVDGGGNAIYTAGSDVWYYFSNSSGTWGTLGTTLWRAVTPVNASPTGATVDLKWSRYYGGGIRWNLIDTGAVSINAVAKTATITVGTSSLFRAERSATGQPASQGATISVTRTVYWRR